MSVIFACQRHECQASFSAVPHLIATGKTKVHPLTSTGKKFGVFTTVLRFSLKNFSPHSYSQYNRRFDSRFWKATRISPSPCIPHFFRVWVYQKRIVFKFVTIGHRSVSQRVKRKAPNRLVERELLINGTNPYGELALKLLCSELCGKSSSELENIAAEDSWAKKSICLARKLRKKTRRKRHRLSPKHRHRGWNGEVTLSFEGINRSEG